MQLENHADKPSFRDDLFVGKTALITGAGRGIGFATARLLCQCGVSALILLGRDHERLAQAASVLEQFDKTRIATFALDFSDPTAVESRLQKIKSQSDVVDILVNNAGIYQTEPVSEHSLVTWQKTLDINLTASMLLTSAFLPAMIEQNWGRIVNVSSISGKAGEAYGAAYSASKFALLGFTQSAALECARNMVTINAICPGWVATDMAFEQIGDARWQSLNNLPPDQAMEFTRLSVPQERLIEPGEVAGLIAFLCTKEARGITGQAINVCGGLSLH